MTEEKFNLKKQDKPNFELIPEGLYGARVARIVELGEHHLTFKGESKDVKQVQLYFTIPSLTIEIDGVEKQQMIRSKRLNRSSNPAATLVKFANAINKDAETLDELLGHSCMIQIVHSEPTQDGTVYANIDNITSPLNGLDIPDPDCDMYYYEIAKGEDEVFAKLPEKVQEYIRESKEFTK